MNFVVCVVCASPRGVGVDRRRACPHRRDVVVLVHSMCQWCRDPLGHNGSVRLCVAIAVVGPQWLPQRVGEARGDDGTSWLYFFVYLRRCGDGHLRPRVVQHGDTPL